MSLEKLSDLTKIQVYHLEALEAGQFEKLPPLVYRSGIFKRLAKFLDIDKNEIMEMYEKESQSEEPTVLPSVAPRKDTYFFLTPKRVAVFLGGSLLILLSVYLWYQFNFLIGPPTLVIEPKSDLVTKDEILSVKGRTDSGIDLTINGESVYVASDGSFIKDIKLADGVNAIEVKAVNNFGKSTKIVRQIFRE